MNTIQQNTPNPSNQDSTQRCGGTRKRKRADNESKPEYQKRIRKRNTKIYAAVKHSISPQLESQDDLTLHLLDKLGFEFDEERNELHQKKKQKIEDYEDLLAVKTMIEGCLKQVKQKSADNDDDTQVNDDDNQVSALEQPGLWTFILSF